MSKEFSAVQIFMKYALPCVAQRTKDGRLPKDFYAPFEKDCLLGKEREKSDLEKMFKTAFDLIAILAKKKSKDVWDCSIITEYWRVAHNKFIDEGKGEYNLAPKNIREFCKVHHVQVLANESGYLVVNLNGKSVKVNPILIPDANKGDTVTIHLGYAIEKIQNG